MYNFYLANRHAISQVVPSLWCSAKTYYEENSKFSNLWNWGDPWLSETRSVEDIIKILEKNPPTVFGCSVYVWNELFLNQLAQEIKIRWPDCVMVYGGPQCNIKYTDDFFKINHWVDFVVPSDAYGEIIIKELLDGVINQDFSRVPYIYYTNEKREKHFNSTPIEKKSFKWPTNIYKSQEQFLLPQIANRDHSNSMVVYESSRGCPYKCTYCDWGGGTYTKISKKPFTTVLDELDWMASNKIYNLIFGDANFGIMEIDVDIAEYIVNLNKKYGFPKKVYVENAKNHIDRVLKIQGIFARANLIDHYKLAIQTIDDDIKKNIERIDMPLDQQIKGIKYLRENFKDLPIKTETIIGLPGMTIQTACNEIDILFENEVPLSRQHIWSLLPETPAYSKEYRTKFKIETVFKGIYSQPWVMKKGVTPDPNVTYIYEDPLTNTESVVQTYSYSRDDWVKVMLLNAFAGAGNANGFNSYVLKYLKDTQNIKPSEIFIFIVDHFFYDDSKFQDQHLKNCFIDYQRNLTAWAYGEDGVVPIDYHPDFPFLFSPLYYNAFLTLTNLQQFYNDVSTALAEHYKDKKLIDLGNYISNAIIDITYDPTTGRKFTVEHNWQEYFSGGKLIKQASTYFLDDTEVNLDTRYQKIDWHIYKHDKIQFKKQFFYQGVGQINVNKLSNTIRLLT